MGTREFSHQYDETVIIHDEMDENDDDEEEESSSLEESEIEEIKFRKTLSAAVAEELPKSSNLMRDDTKSKWEDKEIRLMKLDMQQQLISLEKQASNPTFVDHDEHEKDYKIEIDEDVDDQDERLPSV